MPEIIFIADSNRNILFLNKEGVDLFALNENLGLNHDFINLFKISEQDFIKNQLQTSLEKKLKFFDCDGIEINIAGLQKKFNLKIQFIYHNHESLYLFVGSIFFEWGSGKYDTGEHKISQEFINYLPYGVYRTGIDGKVYYANQGLALILGFDSSMELYGINANDLYVNKSDRALLIKNSFGGEMQSFEIQFYKKNKEIIWVKVNCRIVFNSEGKAVYIDGVIEDITQKKANEQKLIQSESKLKELNLSKDKFFSIISHDLRSPFNQIIGATEMLLTKLEEYDKKMIRKFLTLLNEEAVKSYRLLENLLQWSKNQRGLIKYNPRPLNIRELIKEILLIVEKAAENKKISISVKIATDLYAYADKDMLLTILRNLLSNAVKFTGENGKIATHATQKMDFDTMQSYIEFCVSDNGVGIEEKDIAKLFKMTDSYSAKGTYNETGTGLGLILCKEFVEKHHGKIWVESKVGEGSNFKFTIPL